MNSRPITQAEYDALEHDPIGADVNLLYLLAWMQDIILEDTSQRMKDKGYKFDQEKKRQFKMFSNGVKGLKTHFDATIDQDCIRRIFVYNDKKQSDYDKFREDANSYLKLFALFTEKCSQNADNYNKVFELLESFEGAGIYTNNDIARFNMQRYGY